MLLCTAAALIVGSRVQAPDPGLVLRYKFHVGQKLKYSYKMLMGMDMAMPGQDPMKMAMDSETSQLQNVTSVGTDGTAMISTTVTPVHFLQNGVEVKDPSVSKVLTGSIKMTPNGSVSDVKVDNTVAQASGMDLNSMQINGQVPDGPVKVGTAWDGSIDMKGMGKTKIHYTIAKIETVDGDVLATIHGLGSFDVGQLVTAIGGAQGLGGTGVSSFTFDSVFDSTTGILKSTVMSTTYTLDMKGKDATSPTMKMKGDQKMSITLVSAS